MVSIKIAKTILYVITSTVLLCPEIRKLIQTVLVLCSAGTRQDNTGLVCTGKYK